MNFIVDNYWNKKITEQEMTTKINLILSNNKEKIFLKDKYTKAIIHKCGKKRLELINKVRKEEK